MNIDTQMENGVIVISLGGKIDGASSPELEKALGEHIERGERHIVLDLNDVFYVSSAGLRVVLSAAKQLYGKGKIVLARLQKEVRDVFEMTGFDTIISIFDDVQTAKEQLRTG